RDGYKAARNAKDNFAANFYLNLLPPAERPAVIARADVEALVKQTTSARQHLIDGKPELALAALIETAEPKRAKHGAEHPETLEARQELASFHRQMGQFDKAIPIFVELVKVREAQNGRDHSRMIDAIRDLANTYQSVGSMKEAEPLLIEIANLE